VRLRESAQCQMHRGVLRRYSPSLWIPANRPRDGLRLVLGLMRETRERSRSPEIPEVQRGGNRLPSKNTPCISDASAHDDLRHFRYEIARNPGPPGASGIVQRLRCNYCVVAAPTSRPTAW
jgi:hypothetical protein